MRSILRVLVFCLISAGCFGGSIVYLRIHKNVLAERVTTTVSTPAKRAQKLRNMFRAGGCPADQIAEQKVPKQEFPNVLCRLPGNEPGTIVVSAPLDFAAGPDQETQWATLALLPLLAESLAPAPHRFSLTFVGFAGTDHGLRGSAEFLKQLSEPQRSQIVAMISLDRLGRTPAAYVLGQDDPLLANWLSVAATSLHIRAVPTEINARSVNAQLINGQPDFRAEDYLLDARSFQHAKVPTIALQSAPTAMVPAIRRSGAWPDELAGTGFDLDIYEQTYNQLCVYILLLDSNLGRAHAAAPMAMASMAPAPTTAQPNGPRSASAKAPIADATRSETSSSARSATPSSFPAASQQSTQGSTPLNVPVFHTQAELVLLDVSVTDAKGSPVRGLQAGDFTLYEDGKSQQVRVFEEHSSKARAEAMVEAVDLPPGTYSNRLAASESAPLGIVLFDLLNTPVQDQAYARAQMVKFLKAVPQGEHLALFILGTDLRMVQGFTDNAKTLVAAAEKVMRDISPLYTTEAQNQQDRGFTEEIGRHAQPTLPSGAPASAQQSFEAASAESTNFLGSVSQRTSSLNAMEGIRTDQRTTITLDALTAIARTVGGYPGRKNLLWLSGSFQIRLRPSVNASLTVGERVTQVATPVADLMNTANYRSAIRRVSTMLAAARLAVYPIDVRGVRAAGVDLSVGSDQSRAMVDPSNNDAFEKTLQNQSETRFDERSSMMDLASQTGGQVFLNNDIRRSIERSLDQGANYYTLAYRPEKSGNDTNFRKVEVKVALAGVNLAYRAGYYPILSQESLKENAARTLAAAMQPGLPRSTMLLITARVQPPDAGSKAVRIDYHISTDGIFFTSMENHSQRAVLDCMAVALDSRGGVAGQVANTMDAQIPPDQFPGYQRSGLPLHQEMVLSPGVYDLRLGVLDRTSQRVGTVAVKLVVPEPQGGKP